MKMRKTLRSALAALAGAAVLTGGLQIALAAAETPDLAGLQLGMTAREVLDRYPQAELRPETPTLYCHGRPLLAKQVERAVGLWERGSERLTLKFHRQGAELRLNSISHSRPASFEAEDFEALRKALIRQHGPYSRLLIPAKLDAARLKVGFEWSLESIARSYRIHHDTHGSGNDLFVTQRLTSWLPDSHLQTAANRQQQEIYRLLRRQCKEGHG